MKRRTKRFWLGALAGGALVAAAGGAWGATFIQLVDASGDGAVTASAGTTFLFDSSYYLYYTRGAGWTPWDGAVTFESVGPASTLDLGLSTAAAGASSMAYLMSEDASLRLLNPTSIKVTWIVEGDDGTDKGLTLTLASQGDQLALSDTLPTPPSAVPVPSAVLLLATGLAGLGIFGRRK